MTSLTPREKALAFRYFICAVIFLAYFVVYFHRVCPAVIARDMQADFGAGRWLLGLLGAAYFYAYGLMQIPTGLLTDSWGPRRTVALSFLVAAVGAVLMGLAPNLGLAVAGRVLVGVGVSTVFVANYKLLAEWFDTRQYVIVGALFQTVGGLGALSAEVPLAWLSEGLGWRWTLVAVGVLTLITAGLVWLVVRDRPQSLGWPALRVPAPLPADEHIGLAAGMARVIKKPGAWLLGAWVFCGTGVTFALVALWGGPYLMDVHHLSKPAAGGVLSMFAVGLIVGSPVVGWAANRFGRKPILVVCSLILIAALAILLIFSTRLPVAALYVVFFLICMGGASIGPVQATMSKEMFPVAMAGTAVGMINLFPFLGAGVWQVVMGAVLIENPSGVGHVPASYHNLLLVGLGASLVALAAAVFLPETRPAGVGPSRSGAAPGPDGRG
jgi:sugar phosphate permease